MCHCSQWISILFVRVELLIRRVELVISTRRDINFTRRNKMNNHWLQQHNWLLDSNLISPLCMSLRVDFIYLRVTLKCVGTDGYIAITYTYKYIKLNTVTCSIAVHHNIINNITTYEILLDQIYFIGKLNTCICC